MTTRFWLTPRGAAFFSVSSDHTAILMDRSFDLDGIRYELKRLHAKSGSAPKLTVKGREIFLDGELAAEAYATPESAIIASIDL